jgi:hypothetical protein
MLTFEGGRKCAFWNWLCSFLELFLVPTVSADFCKMYLQLIDCAPRAAACSRAAWPFYSRACLVLKILIFLKDFLLHQIIFERMYEALNIDKKIKLISSLINLSQAHTVDWATSPVFLSQPISIGRLKRAQQPRFQIFPPSSRLGHASGLGSRPSPSSPPAWPPLARPTAWATSLRSCEQRGRVMLACGQPAGCDCTEATSLPRRWPTAPRTTMTGACATARPCSQSPRWPPGARRAARLESRCILSCLTAEELAREPASATGRHTSAGGPQSHASRSGPRHERPPLPLLGLRWPTRPP